SNLHHQVTFLFPSPEAAELLKGGHQTGPVQDSKRENSFQVTPLIQPTQERQRDRRSPKAGAGSRAWQLALTSWSAAVPSAALGWALPSNLSIKLLSSGHRHRRLWSHTLLSLAIRRGRFALFDDYVGHNVCAKSVIRFELA